jgi:superfamily II DNA helicase RecQ
MLDASKKAPVRRTGAYSEADLLTVARKLYNSPDLQLRVPGQRQALLAVMGTQHAEQVVAVLATGSGETLIPMVGASVADARTTILVLPMVALRGDMLRRCLLAGIQPLTWTSGLNQSASLVVVSAEDVCTSDFLDYAHALVRRQALDRIIVDEGHLTITANDYRRWMAQLWWYMRQVRTQTVWLTATLPPVMQAEFIRYNKLVQPQIIRESTNRPHIQYRVRSEAGAGSLVQKAADLIRSSWPRGEIFDHGRDKIVVYCRRPDEARELGELLRCPTYTSESGSEEEKGAIIARWLGDPLLPVIAANRALGVGFDYPHVRWVVHVNAPLNLTDVSQESGRAGRDGRKACSIVMLASSWTPDLTGALSADQEAMQLYLTQRHCSRGVLSQFLDDPADWRWCMGSDEACQVCGEPHVEARPSELRFVLRPEAAAPFTGP